MVGVAFDFPLLRAEKRDKRWLIPLAVAGVVGVWGLLSLDLVFDLVLKLVPSCCGVGCVEFPRGVQWICNTYDRSKEGLTVLRRDLSSFRPLNLILSSSFGGLDQHWKF